MPATLPVKKIELHHHQPENHFEIELGETGVVIRAARDNFSEKRKRYFVRELFAEGFIPDHCQKFLEPGPNGRSSIRWVIDHSPFTHPALRLQANRFAVRIFLAACFLWLLLLALAITTHG